MFATPLPVGLLLPAPLVLLSLACQPAPEECCVCTIVLRALAIVAQGWWRIGGHRLARSTCTLLLHYEASGRQLDSRWYLELHPYDHPGLHGLHE